jgi:hypothetical protein
MTEQRKDNEVVEVSVGYAAGDTGMGVAYAAIHGRRGIVLERAPFSVRRLPALADREAGYAALLAAADRVGRRYAGPVRFTIDDEALVGDLNERRPLPAPLTMPYVALRCRLNRFRFAEVVRGSTGETSDLSARAIAEVSLNVAA